MKAAGFKSIREYQKVACVLSFLYLLIDCYVSNSVTCLLITFP